MTDERLPTIAKERLPYHPAMEERYGIDRSSWRALTDAVFPAARTAEGIILAMSYCRARNLDVFKRPVHVVPIWDSERRQYIESVWSGIGELRTTAFRTGLYAGADPAAFGPDVTRQFSGETKGGHQQISLTYPEWCQITVYRVINGQIRPWPGPRVYWTETYARMGKSELPNDMWRKRPRGQLEKCAEAAALRRAFPEELGEQYTADEIGDQMRDITPTQPEAPPTPTPVQPATFTNQVRPAESAREAEAPAQPYTNRADDDDELETKPEPPETRRDVPSPTRSIPSAPDAQAVWDGSTWVKRKVTDTLVGEIADICRTEGPALARAVLSPKLLEHDRVATMLRAWEKKHDAPIEITGQDDVEAETHDHSEAMESGITADNDASGVLVTWGEQPNGIPIEDEFEIATQIDQALGRLGSEGELATLMNSIHPDQRGLPQTLVQALSKVFGRHVQRVRDAAGEPSFSLGSS